MIYYVAAVECAKANLTGKSLRWSQRKLNEIRKALDKKRKQIVKYEEFCKFMGMGGIKLIISDTHEKNHDSLL